MTHGQSVYATDMVGASPESLHDSDLRDVRIIQSIHDGFQKWTQKAAPSIDLLSEVDATASVDVINRYTVKFGSKLSQGMGRGEGRNPVYSQRELAQHAKEDIVGMTTRLVDTVADITGRESRQLFPEVPAATVMATGTSAVYTSTCSVCAGTASVTCRACSGTLRCACTQCVGGQARCTVCSGSGQITNTCYSCGGAGGSYSAPATWDHQYQQNTWDYQNRQTAAGGQWQTCIACGGSRGSRTNCTSCQYGKVSCMHCAGRGFNDCGQCNQSGRVACVKCLGGYNYSSYSPQAEVKHTHELVAASDSSDLQRRIIKLTRSRLDDFGEPVGEALVSRDKESIVRTHRWDIPATLHTVRSKGREYSVLSVDHGAHVLDYAAIGDVVLEEKLAAFEHAAQVTEAGLSTRSFHALPIHTKAASTLAAHIGFKSLIPIHKLSPAAIETKFLAGAAHFVSSQYADRYVTAMGAQLRSALLKTHGVGVLFFMMALIPLAMARHFGWDVPLLAGGATWWWVVALMIPLSAEALLWLRYPFGRIAHGLLTKNALHWVLVAFYPLLALLFSRVFVLPPLA